MYGIKYIELLRNKNFSSKLKIYFLYQKIVTPSEREEIKRLVWLTIIGKSWLTKQNEKLISVWTTKPELKIKYKVERRTEIHITINMILRKQQNQQ